MNLFEDMFDGEAWEAMISEGFVRRQYHPTLPLAILNYTPKTQYSKTWNEITKQCRGLIYDLGSGDLVARPFPKFFNMGELSDDEIPMEPFKVFEKMDGSLGILYPCNDGLAIATRGSFMSEQAKWATAWLRTHHPTFVPIHGLTYLFEIIYPANRIVVDYGDREDLVLLDVIDNETGRSAMHMEAMRPRGSVQCWRGSVVQEYDGFDALESLLAAEQPLNSEGYVIRFESGMRAKVKHDEYVRLHRIVTGVSTKTVYQVVATAHMKGRLIPAKRIGRAIGVSTEAAEDMATLDVLLDRVPDEFYEWVRTVEDGLNEQYLAVLGQCTRDFGDVCSSMTVDGLFGSNFDRREFAQRIAAHPHKDLLFLLLDGRELSDAIWKRLEPTYEKPFMTVSEDTA